MRSLRIGWAGVALSLALFAACGNDTSGESSDDVGGALDPVAVRAILENGVRRPSRCAFLTEAQAERLLEVVGEPLDGLHGSEYFFSEEAAVTDACTLETYLGFADTSVDVYDDDAVFADLVDSVSLYDRVGEFAVVDDLEGEYTWRAYYLENDVIVSMQTDIEGVDRAETVAMLDELLTILEEEVASG